MAYTTSPIPLSYEEHYRLCSVLSSSTTKIITASTARLYESRFDAPRNAWAYTGLKGIVVFGYDSSSRSSRRHAANYWFKLVDIRRGKVIWQHEIRQAIEYEAEMPFFHAFSGELCKFGFRFDEDENAAIVFQEVSQRVAEISVSRPASHSSTASSSSKLSSKSSKPAFEPTPKASSSQRRGVERSKISAPVSESFEHVAHMGVDDSANFNVTPEWTKLLNRLEGLGVDADMVEENFEFVKGFLAGAEAIRSTPTSPPKSHTHPSPSSSRTPSVDSLDYYEHNPGPYARDRKPRNVLRKPAPSNFYQY